MGFSTSHKITKKWFWIDNGWIWVIILSYFRFGHTLNEEKFKLLIEIKNSCWSSVSLCGWYSAAPPLLCLRVNIIVYRFSLCLLAVFWMLIFLLLQGHNEQNPLWSSKLQSSFSCFSQASPEETKEAWKAKLENLMNFIQCYAQDLKIIKGHWELVHLHMWVWAYGLINCSFLDHFKLS